MDAIPISLLEKFQRLTNFLAAAQLYLKENTQLQETLRPDHLKDRLLGHWGTCPGINMIYAHLNRAILLHHLNCFLITGPGHGAPANLANLYLEGTLQKFYPELTLDRQGWAQFVKRFSWPGGFPSHLSPAIPGTIHEGGELGYALSTAFGAIMDNPDLVVACIVGDGEAETGPTATAWNGYKFIDPRESGAVLPIVHINGYKISNPTLFGSMTDQELSEFFHSLGYLPLLVTLPELNQTFVKAIDKSISTIRSIQKKARSTQQHLSARWPVILFRSPKGMSGVVSLDGEPVEGSYRSHGIPIKDPKENKAHFKLLKGWLESYRIHELLDKEGRPLAELLQLTPQGNKRMGCHPATYSGLHPAPLRLPPLFDFATPLSEETRGTRVSSMKMLGKYLTEVVRNNPHTFRIFSPDELESNRLDELFTVTHRNFQGRFCKHDKNVSADGGRIIETLSEHNCQGWMQGYLQTGRHALFPSYEAFLPIISSMMSQHAKFLKLSSEVTFRGRIPSFNYLETSTLWRQEHNGYSHQNPDFIHSLLDKKAQHARIYLPPDGNSLVSTMEHCLESRGYINLVIASKEEMPQWLSMKEAIAHCRAGASIWKWASNEEGTVPDVTLVGIGDNPTVEVMAAIQLLFELIPALKIRMVNVTDLFILGADYAHPHGLQPDLFNDLFPLDRPVIFNSHGYPTVLKQLLFDRPGSERFIINGYIEEGTTTTPFDMNVRNKTSRYHIAIQAIRQGARHNLQVAKEATALVSQLEYILKAHREHILTYGTDPEEIREWRWKKGSE